MTIFSLEKPWEKIKGSAGSENIRVALETFMTFPDNQHFLILMLKMNTSLFQPLKKQDFLQSTSQNVGCYLKIGTTTFALLEDP